MAIIQVPFAIALFQQIKILVSNYLYTFYDQALRFYLTPDNSEPEYMHREHYISLIELVLHFISVHKHTHIQTHRHRGQGLKSSAQKIIFFL